MATVLECVDDDVRIRGRREHHGLTETSRATAAAASVPTSAILRCQTTRRPESALPISSSRRSIWVRCTQASRHGTTPPGPNRIRSTRCPGASHSVRASSTSRRVTVITSSTSSTFAMAVPSDRSKAAIPPASPAPSDEPVRSRRACRNGWITTMPRPSSSAWSGRWSSAVGRWSGSARSRFASSCRDDGSSASRWPAMRATASIVGCASKRDHSMSVRSASIAVNPPLMTSRTSTVMASGDDRRAASPHAACAANGSSASSTSSSRTRSAAPAATAPSAWIAASADRSSPPRTTASSRRASRSAQTVRAAAARTSSANCSARVNRGSSAMARSARDNSSTARASLIWNIVTRYPGSVGGTHRSWCPLRDHARRRMHHDRWTAEPLVTRSRHGVHAFPLDHAVAMPIAVGADGACIGSPRSDALAPVLTRTTLVHLAPGVNQVCIARRRADSPDHQREERFGNMA